MSLAVRAGVLIALLLAAFCGIALVVVDRAESAVVDVERPRLQAQTAQLAEAVTYGVLAHSPALLEGPLSAFLRNPDLAQVTVFDDANAVLVEHRGTTRDDNLVVVDADVVTRASVPGDDGDLAAYGIGAAAAARVGSVRVAYALSGVAEVQARLRRAIFVSVAGIGLFALVLSTVLASGLVSRVRRVASAARRVSGGDLAVTVDDGGDDEVAQLAKDFNAMTASLVVQQQRLQEQGTALAERESLAALGRATAVIAHELRNPLGIVLAAAELVKNEARPLAVRAEAAGLIEDEVRRLERTLADLLASARPRTPELRDVDVAAVVRDAAARLQRAGGPAEGLHLEVSASSSSSSSSASSSSPSASASTSSASSSAHARCDPAFVEQIVWNLVQNAAQAGARRVDIELTHDATTLSVSVRDDGPGIDPALRERLFQPFSTTKQRGTGLGLSASRRMAADMGGDLRFVAPATQTPAPTTTTQTAPTPPPATGACFLLTLPRGPR